MAASPRSSFDSWSIGPASNKTNKYLSPGTSAQELDRPPTLIGESEVMRQLFAVIDRIAQNDCSVLLTGATGTGKELVARAIHEKSSRCDGPFVDINCAAIPETLIEAELFGHQRGTFTGAHENRCGLFEQASGGTVFLDEVDALNPAAQVKLLRVLQERTIRRIGARANIAIDVRIISATNSDLSQLVAANRFRADLYYRLRVLPIHLPELCSRGEDIRLLTEHFLKVKAKSYGNFPPRFTPEAMHLLADYPWPGNVRELENTIEYALAVGKGEELCIDSLPLEISQTRAQHNSLDFKQTLEAYITETVPLAEIEKRYILSVLQHFGGNQVRAAAALGIDRSKLYRRLRQYGVRAVKFLQEEQIDGMQLRSGAARNGLAGP